MNWDMSMLGTIYITITGSIYGLGRQNGGGPSFSGGLGVLLVNSYVSYKTFMMYEGLKPQDILFLV